MRTISASTSMAIFFRPKVYFPNGLKPIADRCHELGLKFGVHLMRGIPRRPMSLTCRSWARKYTARDIANTDPKENCKWCTILLRRRHDQARRAGMVRRTDSAHRRIWASISSNTMTLFRIPTKSKPSPRRLPRTGKPIVLSLSPGGDVDPEAIEFFRMANMLRVTKDVWDEQSISTSVLMPGASGRAKSSLASGLTWT